MPNIITKTKLLLKENKQKEFFEKFTSYLRYIILSIWYRFTLKETDPELKKVNKNWIIYTFLKSRYSGFIKKYKKVHKFVHQYSDRVW